MINYILGVKREDSYRFTLVNENQSSSRAESQTSEVTVYKINHQQGFKIDYSLTIVDSPGFGDTRSAAEDKEISEHLCNLFSAELVGEVNAVCLVLQAALARLKQPQIFVFESVLSNAGKDLAENIRVLVTFADGQRPPVLEAINASGVPCPKTTDGLPFHFKFNNSALFAHNTSSAADCTSDFEAGGFDKMFWDVGEESMKRFFDALSVMKTKSLTETKEVLRKRQQLQNLVEKLQKQFPVGLDKLQEIKQSAQRLEELKAEVCRNDRFDFESSTKEALQVEISGAGNYFATCVQCRTTCHRYCQISNSQDRRQCWVIGSTGRCTRCPGRCYWTQHVSHKYKSESVEVTKKQSGKELKAREAMRDLERSTDQLRDEYDVIQAEVERLTERCVNCWNRLEEIALMSDPLSRPEYINMLIEAEESEAEPGWQERVQELVGQREKAEFMAKVKRGEIYLPIQCHYQHPLKSKARHDNAEMNIKRRRLDADAETHPDVKDETQQLH
ncbi:hypothetical protein L3Q82_005985 [Scortum barcoo]|uniref:Uncharacterized protein n=1 Tax=Scortum barcoo TaxID=214431 RepID=A0ACB8X2A0_9TELE|nr:hypothetical protein L3Q82_005985 [Scortum barcoo]